MPSRSLRVKLPEGGTAKGVNLKALIAGRRSKYRAVRTEYNGVSYASKAEARRAEELTNDPNVIWFIGQPKFRLGVPENVYVPDFLVCRETEVNHGEYWPECHAEDVKGMRTPKFNRDVKLWKRYGKMPLHIISGKKVEVITPGGPRCLTP